MNTFCLTARIPLRIAIDKDNRCLVESPRAAVAYINFFGSNGLEPAKGLDRVREIALSIRRGSEASALVTDEELLALSVRHEEQKAWESRRSEPMARRMGFWASSK